MSSSRLYWALVAAAVAVPLILLVVQPAGSASVCARAEANGMKFERKRGLRYGRLTWPGRRGTTYRVFRSGVVVGQTRRRSMPVRVKAGRLYAFSVKVVRTSGVVANCVGNLRQRVAWYPPAKTRKPVVRKTGELGVRMRWRRPRLGDGRLAGYRVYRDGRVQRQVRGRSARVRLTSGATYRMQVAALDTKGRVGAPSEAVVVQVGHEPPGAPGAITVGGATDTEVALSWGAAPRGTARIAGYRIYRDGTVVRQVAGLSANIGNLAPAAGYTFTVAAVDTRGYLGPMTPAVQLKTALPPPSDGRIHAFLLASTDASFEALQRSYRRIGALYPTYFNCRWNTSTIVGKDDPLVTAWAKLRRIPVMPRFNCQHPNTLRLILTNPAAREASIQGIMNLVLASGYEGINLDFESGYEDDADDLVTYVRMLGRRLHNQGRKLSLEVSAKWNGFSTSRNRFYDYERLVVNADHVFVMNWGYHWSTSVPGSPDDLPYVKRAADYAASMPFKRRFVIGSPLYGMDWPAGGGPAHPATALHHSEVMALMARYGARPRLDPTAYSWTFKYTDARGVGHDVWFNDRTTIAARMQVAKDRGLGFGVWRLGQEDPGVWDVPLAAPANWPR
ncbi:MAG TPA: glycosyl hydrolase family 18 protein [Micromonosporaceae bacterium]|nr:glycosyl hydrolase family 18 protein [Micromonosporaceae bacterium]